MKLERQVEVQRWRSGELEEKLRTLATDCNRLVELERARYEASIDRLRDVESVFSTDT